MAMGGLLGICVLLSLHLVIGTSIKHPDCTREGHFMLHPSDRCKYVRCVLSLRSGTQNHYQAVTQECPLGTGVPRYLYEKEEPDYSSRGTLCTDSIPYGNLEACRVLDLPGGKSMRPGRGYESVEYDDDFQSESDEYEEPYYRKRTGRRRDTSQESPHKWYNILVESKLQEDLHSREEDLHSREEDLHSREEDLHSREEDGYSREEDLYSREEDVYSREDSRETSHEPYLQATAKRRSDIWRDKHKPTRYSSIHHHKGRHYRRSPHGKSWKHGGTRRDGNYKRSTNRGYETRRISDPQFSSSQKRNLPKLKFQYKSKTRNRDSKPSHFDSFSNSMKRGLSGGSYSDSKHGRSDFDNNYYSSRKSAKKDFDKSYYGLPTDPYPMKKDFDTDFYSSMGSSNKGPSTDFFSSPSFPNKDLSSKKGSDTSFFSSPSFSSKDGSSGFGALKGSSSDFFSSPSFSSKDDSLGFGASKGSSSDFFSSPSFSRKGGRSKGSSSDFFSSSIQNNNSGYGAMKSSTSNFFSRPSFGKKDIGSSFGTSKGYRSDMFSSPSFSKKDSTSNFFSNDNHFPNTFDKKNFYKDFKYDFPYGKHGSNIGQDRNGDFVNKDGKKGIGSKNTFGYENSFGKNDFPYDYDYKYPYGSNPFSKQSKGSEKAAPGSQSKSGNAFGKNGNIGMFTKSSIADHAKVTPYPWNNLGYVVVHTTPSPAQRSQNSQRHHGQNNAYKPAENVGSQSNMNPDTQSNVRSAANVHSASNVQSASKVQSALHPVQQQQQQRRQNTQQGAVNSVPSSTGYGNYGNAEGQTNQYQGQSNGKENQGSSQINSNQGGRAAGQGGQYHPLQQSVPREKQANQGDAKDSVRAGVNNPMLPYTYTPSYLVDWYSKVTGLNNKTGNSAASPKDSHGAGGRNGEWRKKPSESGNTQENPGYSQPMPRDWPSKFARYEELGLGRKTIDPIGGKPTSTGFLGSTRGNTQNGFRKNGFGDKSQGYGRTSPRYGRGRPLRGGKQVMLGQTKSNFKEPLFNELKSDPNQNGEKLPFGHEVVGRTVEVDKEGGGIKIRYHGESSVSLDGREGQEPQAMRESPVLPRPPHDDASQELDSREHPRTFEQRGGEVENATPSHPPTPSIPRLPRDIVADIVDRAYDQKYRPALKFDSEIADTEEVEPNFFFSRS